MADINKDWETEGMGKQVKGKVHEFVGEMTGDESEKLKGKTEQAGGKIQEKLGQLGHKIDRENRKDI
jgi:uncharacterized protein YjbJ (UPF0337 family)